MCTNAKTQVENAAIRTCLLLILCFRTAYAQGSEAAQNASDGPANIVMPDVAMILTLSGDATVLGQNGRALSENVTLNATVPVGHPHLTPHGLVLDGFGDAAVVMEDVTSKYGIWFAQQPFAQQSFYGFESQYMISHIGSQLSGDPYAGQAKKTGLSDEPIQEGFYEKILIGGSEHHYVVTFRLRPNKTLLLVVRVRSRTGMMLLLLPVFIYYMLDVLNSARGVAQDNDANPHKDIKMGNNPTLANTKEIQNPMLLGDNEDED
jgi:hypothetical protein